MTLHKLLYDSYPKKNGGFYRKPKTSLPYSVIVADECSMIPKSMVEMLLKHHVYVLFLGDPGQLPVINKDDAHDLLDHPHIFLDQVMRQAAESEIIQLTMKIRNGESFDCFKGNEVQVLEKGSLNTGMLTWADQIICATNASRISLNNQVRNLLGYHGTPQNGERMICLRNYWEDLSDDGNSALVNGTTGIIQNPFGTYRMAPGYVKMRSHKMDEICGDFITDDGHTFNSVEMDRKMIETGEPCLDWRESYALGRLRNKIGDIVPKQFTYGYAITAWKAQGSEWNKVLIVEERFPFNREEHARWLYTAVSRGSEKCVLIKDS
jgi:exodeoxyribonuclease V